VSLLCAVITVVRGGVASELAPDRAGMPLQQSRDLRHRTSRHSMRRYAVSFFLGELVILTHVCNLLLAG
jgi:hypothetical protein